MKHYYLTLLALTAACLFILHIGCQQQNMTLGMRPKEAENADKASMQGPKITFEKVAYDFGDVTARKKYTCEFKFKNTGDSLLSITEVKRCCGTVTRLDKKEFSPGESGVLNVEYLSGPNYSVMKRIIYVSSNDKDNPKVELTISAQVIPKVTCEPQKLNLVLMEENAGCPDIILTSVDSQPFSIKAFRSTGDSITVDVDPSVEATEFVLQPKVDLEKLQSRPVGFISIDMTHPDCEKIYLSFSTLLRFKFTPQSIIVFNPEPQKPIVKTISVVSSYNEDFEIESSSSKNGTATVLNQEKIANGYKLEVEITPPPSDDEGKFMDVLYVKMKGGETLSINCYVRYLKE